MIIEQLFYSSPLQVTRNVKPFTKILVHVGYSSLFFFAGMPL